ncbi:hypothetical protein V8E51_012652 [Hyaloscypha variabilis]
MAPIPQLIVPSEPQSQLSTTNCPTNRRSLLPNIHYRPENPLTQYLTYPKIQTIFTTTTNTNTSSPKVPCSHSDSDSHFQTTSLYPRSETLNVDSHALYNATLRAENEAKDTNFAKQNGPWVGVLVGGGALIVVGLLVIGWVKRRKEKRKGRRAGMDGRDGKEGEEHEMGDAVDGAFRVEDVEGEEERRREG